MVGRSGPRLIAAALGLLLCLAAGAVLSAQRGGGAAAAPDPVAPPAPTIALTGARVFDGTGAAPADGMTILMVKGRIQAVGPDGTVRLPADATRVDMSGKTVMPGLINAHGHLDAGDEKEPLYDRINKQLQTYAQYGVTTVVTLGDDGKESVKVRDENDKGDPVRAHLYVSGPAVVAKTADEAKKAIDAAADAKVNIIKTRMEGNKDDMTPEVFAALIEQAHNRGLRVAAHLYYLKDAKALVNAGLDIIGHSIRDLDVDAAFIEELKKRNVGYIPTLTRDLSVFVYETTPAFFTDPFFLKGEAAYKPQMDQLKEPARQRRTRDNPQTDQIKKALVVANRNLKRLSDAGVPIALGTDSGASLGRWQGYFEHVELEMMVKAGMTPMQALVAATGGAAKIMRRNEIGTIQAGRRADLLVLNADPLASITNTRQIHSVYVGGRQVQ
jgi:imidazolonepropionase-like amidohydrolase